MPEIKNTFLAGKMNKSLDDRILPQGEYRDALNVQITKAEDSDVGVIHNIKGNKAVTNVSLTGDGYDVIGSIFDDKNNVVYWIVTNNTNGYIFRWAVGDSQAQKIVSSESPNDFLGLSKSYKITGINILEDFLFWTDNYNPPRKINITRAIADNSYYDSRVKVSVAKYAPYLAPQVTTAEHDETIKSKLIQNEFIRFGYRYKFEDNEYSVLSPFTPIVFKMETNIIDTSSSYYQTSDLLEIGASTEIDLMTNHVNKVTMNIPLPQVVDDEDAVVGTGAKEDFQIKEIDILYKESDSNAVRVIETIKVSNAFTQKQLEYVYKCTSFKATLAEEQITRVFDAVPLKAKAQEIVGNRVVYGNITSKRDLPEIDFLASYEAKENTNDSFSQHSVKQRRTYEAGIVLSDIYGRTSPVITTDESTIYVGAKGKTFDNSTYNGSALKMIFKTFNDNAGVLYDKDTNPDGWYSYKIVVKQKEQEYYNVYVPGVWNYGIAYRSYFQIHGDNINKIPRDFEGEPNNNLFYPSKVRVYPKVLNVNDRTGIRYRNSDFGILEVIDIGEGTEENLVGIARLYESSKNHLVGKIQNVLGTYYNDFLRGGDFAVFETEPVESLIDIYFETPTTGLISEITDALESYVIDDTTPIAIDSYNNFSADFPEDLTFNGKIGNIYARRKNPEPGDPLEGTFVNEFIPGSLVSFSITSQVNGDGDATSDIGVRFNEGDGQWELYLLRGVNYDTIDNAGNNSRTLNVTVTFLNENYSQTGLSLTIENVKPTAAASFNYVYFNLAGTGSTGGTRTESLNVVSGNATNVLFKIYGATGGRSSNVDANGVEERKKNITFEFYDDGDGATSNDAVVPTEGTINYGTGTPTPTYRDFFSIIENNNIRKDDNGNDELFTEYGTSLVIYHENASASDLLDVDATNIKEVTFKVLVKENTDASTGFGSNALDSDIVEVKVDFDDAGAISSSDELLELYHAPSTTFSNAFEACQSPVGSSDWSPVTIYWKDTGYTNDFPFEEPAEPSDQAGQETAGAPRRIYYDAGLTRFAPFGWYKRPDTGLVGFYYIDPQDSEFVTGWRYNTPAICGTFTKDEAEAEVTYNPPDEVTFEDDDGANPYDLPDFNPRPQP